MYKNMWELADAHVSQILHIITVMGSRGIRVDLKKLAEFNRRLDDEMNRLNSAFSGRPELRELGGFHPPRGFVRPPSIKCMECNGKKKLLKVACWRCEGTGRLLRLDGLVEREFRVTKKLESGASYTELVVRWCKPKPFKATSSPQVLAYTRSKGHTVAKTKEGDDTSGAKALLMAWRKYKDDNYRDFVEFRKLKKLRGTYGKWPLRAVDSDYGEAITKFTLKPTTGRLSSVAPNVQNIPRDGPLAKAFKQCLVARPGHKIVDADLSSAEALATGWLANDPDYMRLARLGTHKFATAKYLKWPVSLSMSDDELRPILVKAAKEHPVLYRKIKCIIFGGNYMAGAPTIFRNNPEDFESQREAKVFLEFCQSLSPKIGVWRQSVIRQAQSAKKLRNPFGYECDFYDLPGGDGPACVAFLPQSIVAAVMKQCMIDLWSMEAGKYMIWQVHDSLVFDVPDDRVEAVKMEIQTVMGQKWEELGGLSFGCEIKIGNDMAS